MGLEIEDKRLGTFSVLAEGKATFTKTHVGLVSLLREPISIAISNALRYEEVVKLKDIVDAENRELSRELRYFSGDVAGLFLATPNESVISCFRICFVTSRNISLSGSRCLSKRAM